MCLIKDYRSALWDVADEVFNHLSGNFEIAELDALYEEALDLEYLEET